MMTPDQLSNTIFSPIKKWAEASSGNWNTLLGVSFILLIVGLILMGVYYKKIGTPDERTNQIHLRSAYIILLVVVISDLIFPKEYMWQIFFLLKYASAFIAAGIFLAIQYTKDSSY